MRGKRVECARESEVGSEDACNEEKSVFGVQKVRRKTEGLLDEESNRLCEEQKCVWEKIGLSSSTRRMCR